MTPLFTGPEPEDAAERERAVTTFDHNLVVTAGAGTGKTTLLVDRLVHLLVRNPEPLKITDIVALTFTNKAANEMKLRLRERLQSYLAVRLDAEPANDLDRAIRAEVGSLIERYQLSKGDLDERVQEAVRNIERSEIGTIHSFAATLLRLYPLEAGVDPQFKEDDGKEFEGLFDEQWGLWLDQELSLQGTRPDQWKKILKKFSLSQITELAKSLCSEAVDLRPGTLSPKDEPLPEPIATWLRSLRSRAARLLESHPEERLNEKLVGAAQSVIEGFHRSQSAPDDSLRAAATLLLSGGSINTSLKGWPQDDIQQAQELVRAARGLCQVDPLLTHLLWELLVPFANKMRQFFVHEGFVSFDGLLIRARNLVRDRPRVRSELKRQFRAMLIDEFQDTDPIQYEILLYLAERTGREAKDWRSLELAPGKVFVVGDPKQSIYAFRRADIEAYLQVAEKIIKAQDGIECRLTTNFRSHTEILEVVNGVFESLIEPKDGVQPGYIAIQPAPRTSASDSGRQEQAPLPRAMVRKIVGEDEALSAENARRLEAEGLARWLHEEILGKAVILNPEGEQVQAQPKDIALLFRKLTDIEDYLEPLRRRGIRYVVEGERHFYTAKEIIDAVNLFRAVENPHDRLALVGVLRSPLGGLTDQMIYELHQKNLLDYRARKHLSEKEFPPTVRDLYALLDTLHKETRRLPVGEAVSRIFNTLPVKALAACSFHGEQAVANLEKLRQQADVLGRAGSTLKEAIHQLERRVLEVKEEGESVLAEENLDAVRIMSIHKAKGLEFPIVVLVSCQSGTDARQAKGAEALFDWSTGLTGLHVGQTWDIAGLYIAEKARLRSEEEQKRILYVAMTRPREHLVISCVPTGRQSNGSFLCMLDEPLHESIASAVESSRVAIGSGSVTIEVSNQSLIAPGRTKSKRRKAGKNPSWKPYIDAWTRRREIYAATLKTPLFVTPTLLRRQEQQLTEWAIESTRGSYHQTPALIVGDLAHRFLQEWDFSADKQPVDDALSAFLDRWLQPDENSREQIQTELREIFRHFFGSTIYAELAASRILGREVPLLMPWDGQVMEGVIDLIYERDGLLYIADYKTDRVVREELSQLKDRYRHQAEVYSQAVQQSLQRPVAAFKLVFLRLDEAIEVDRSWQQGELFFTGQP
jgi:ATP-dependent helicase/nuclease subunit A